jgi:hypothetical protein
MFTVLALAGQASAAPGQVTVFRFHGVFANALWFTSSATSFTATSVNVSTSMQGSELFVDQFTGNLNANGNFTGGTDTSADVTSGFLFAIQKSQLATAGTSGSGLPATTCTIDATGNPVSCTATTIDANAAWTGQGPISRSVSNHHFKTNGFSENDHFNGTDRAATATGTVGGLTLSTSALQFADLGTANSGTITVCKGTGC